MYGPIVDGLSSKTPELLAFYIFKILLYSVLIIGTTETSQSKHFRACHGSENGFSLSQGHEGEEGNTKYEKLKSLYTKDVIKKGKCTFIQGNLEISGIKESEKKPGEVYDFEFLSEISEISGYLLLYDVEVEQINLPKLVLIRGKNLLSDRFSFYVNSAPDKSKTLPGLKSLTLPNLKEITKGDVVLRNNPNLCYIHLVNFLDIIQPESTSHKQIINLTLNGHSPQCQKLRSAGQLKCASPATLLTTTSSAFSTVSSTLSALVSTAHAQQEMTLGCPFDNCWGPKLEHCQTLTRLICSKKCTITRSSGSVSITRCFGTEDSECCDEACGAGCIGDFRSECNACRVLENDGECVNYCPQGVSYDSSHLVNVRSELKYAYNYRCIPKCPSKTYVERTSCVEKCGPGTRSKGNECVPCEGGSCSKACEMPKKIPIEDSGKMQYSSTFEEALQNCTEMQGHVNLDTVFWEGDTWAGLPRFNISNLHLFNSIKEIKGGLRVTNSPVKNLSFLSNLQRISGNAVNEGGSVVIGDNKNLEYLGLSSLVAVKKLDGQNTIAINNNEKLCYINPAMIANLIAPPANKSEVTTDSNGNPEKCKKSPPCHEQCALIEGEPACWGPGSDNCHRCLNYEFNNSTCVETCDLSTSFIIKSFIVKGNEKCESCHPQCAGNCTGRGPENCGQCRYFEHNGVCVEKCPLGMFASRVDRKCSACAEVCEQDWGCTGDEEKVGEGGCRKCDGTVFIEMKDTDSIDSQYWGINNTCVMEIMEDKSSHKHKCPEGYYSDRYGSNDPSILAGNRLCISCHSECDGCTGFGADECIRCKNHLKEGKCVAECPGSHTLVNDDYDCVKCHDQCHSEEGCVGGSEPWHCVACEGSYYNVTSQHDNTTMTLCVSKCPPEYPYLSLSGQECVSKCGPLEYPDRNSNCKTCHEECDKGCSGGERSDCMVCKNFKVKSSCYKTCPDGWEAFRNKTCVMKKAKASTGNNSTLYIMITGFLALVVLGLLAVWLQKLYCRKRDKLLLPKNSLYPDLDRSSSMGDYSLPHEKTLSPNTPTGVEPSKMKMYIVQKHELKQIGPLGSGAFGTVYKGVWCPENDPKVQLPVAIKVLQDPVPGAEKTFIDEAQFMASVSHPCLLRLLAICMTETPQLVTKLMPHGNLLDYIRKCGHALPSRTFFLWGKQIAEGMEYLETKRIVHRDLAARNVLVQSTKQVKITDFGLAQMLKNGEDSIKFQGGKVPLKWLALESIVDRVFTHASDVWSLGVTLWEIFTLGGKPYAEVTGGSTEMTKVLQEGERLPQPPGATLDLFVVMLKCWLVDPKSRLKFSEIREELSRMYEDADRYFEVQNDRQTKPGSPKDDQEFMLEFLLGQKGFDITGISPSSAPIDNKRTFVDPDDYFSLKPLPNNSTLNSVQVGTPSSKGTGSDSYYVNSPGTGSTVVAEGTSFNPALSLNLPHSSFNNSLGRGVAKRQKSTPTSASAFIDPAAETLLPQATPGAQSGNFFNYEHIPDQRIIQRSDSHETTTISSPLSGIPDYRTVVLGSEPPRVYNPSEYYNAPSVKSPFVSSATPYCNTSNAVPLQSPHYTHLSNVDTMLTNRPSPVSVEHSQSNMNRLSNSNYSPALESTPATPLVIQKNNNGFPFYPSGNSPPNALHLNNNYQSVKNTSSCV